MDLEQTPGQTIADFCGNGFTAANVNHCAHFVCHQLGLDLGMDCRTLTGGRAPGAGVRVHELFAACPQVGRIEDWRGSGDVLVFATRAANVRLADRFMANVPKKHVGILRGGRVFHYSNGRDRVVVQDLAGFRRTFDDAYGGLQGYFYGTIPGAVPALAPAAAQEGQVSHVVRGRDAFARIGGGPEFLVGRRTRYRGRVGLMRSADSAPGHRYDARDYTAQYETWATLVEVIGESESQNRFDCLNTYDRAAFTFGFFQLAAHTPRDNLVLMLRRAVALPEFHALFPALALREGRLHHVDGGTVIDLEAERFDPASGEMQLQALMRYLNPEPGELDAAEIVAAAKLVHLSANSAAFRDLQVRTAVQICVSRFRERYQRWYALGGVADTVCVALADVHHQGRAGKAAVRAALASADPLAALCRLGETKYPERCRSLRAAIAARVAGGRLGTHVYEPAHGLFVPRAG